MNHQHERPAINSHDLQPPSLLVGANNNYLVFPRNATSLLSYEIAPSEKNPILANSMFQRMGMHVNIQHIDHFR